MTQKSLADRHLPRSLLLALYLHATTLGDRLIKRKLRGRLAHGKEDPARFNERLGQPTMPRPPGSLVWFHAASVGESLSILELLRQIRDTYPDISLLVTTGTRSSAGLLKLRLAEGIMHQFVPVDSAGAVEGFLDHWQPDMAVWTESEFWPRLMVQTHARGVPMVLINGRMSAKSARGWGWLHGMSQGLLSRFELLAVQDQAMAERFLSVGAPKSRVVVTGSLKEGAVPLPYDENTRKDLQKAIGRRATWLAASTHEGEEEIVIEAHRLAGPRNPGLLLILVPRHPERADGIADLLTRSGFAVARRSLGQPITADVDIYLADTLGELGLWYRLAPVSFVGGSLFEIGGHNPFEPAALGSAIIHGPHVANFADIYDRLESAGATRKVTDAKSLVVALNACLQADAAATMATAAWEVSSDGSGVTDHVFELLEPYLNRIAEPRA